MYEIQEASATLKKTQMPSKGGLAVDTTIVTPKLAPPPNAHYTHL